MTSSPAISRKVQINGYTYNLTMRRGALADMVQDTLAHFHKALDYAAVGVFDIGENDEGIWYERNWGETDEARVNIWGDIPVTIGGKTVVFSLNQFTETTAAQDLLNLLQEWAFAGANIPYMLDNTQTPPKTQQAASTRVLSPSTQAVNGQVITLGEKEYTIAPSVMKFAELPAYEKGESVAFKVVRIKRTIGKLKTGKDKEVWEFYTKGGGQYPLFKIWGDNKMLELERPLRNELPNLGFAEEMEGQWYVTGDAGEYQGKLSFWWTHAYRVK